MSESNVAVLNMDCREAMAAMPENSVDTVLCDPPYGLTFHGKDWDKGVPGAAFWREALRVAKPGAMLLAFSSTRTLHHLMVAIEDAGWELRDTLMWVYGSGMPKGKNISAEVDRKLGNVRRTVEERKDSRRDGSGNNHHTFQPLGGNTTGGKYAVTEAISAEGKEWEGWSTALKPSWEPIVLAMKPYEGTYAENALKWGVAGLNIDACRIGESGGQKRVPGSGKIMGAVFNNGGEKVNLDKGRWPTNIIHDGSEEVAETLPERVPRWHYCAKAGKRDRGHNNKHPTVKPLDLMRYLCRLTKTPAGGTVLDPFAGSGSTGVAAVLEGRRFIGIEKEPEYYQVMCERITDALAEVHEAEEFHVESTHSPA